MTSFDLTGRTALITGASRGIGRALAVGLARHGADIIGVSRADRNDALADELLDRGRRYRHVQADLSDRDDVRRLVGTVSLEAEVDVLVNNAAIARRSPAERFGDELWDEVLQVDLTAPFVLARELGGRMLDRGYGKVIFFASMMTFQGGREIVAYTAAKSGVAGAVRALANEWAARGVNVNAIAPGYIETDLTAGSHGDRERRQAFQNRIPAGRWGRPDDIVGATVFLASPAADYIHGVVLPVDGGWLVR